MKFDNLTFGETILLLLEAGLFILGLVGALYFSSIYSLLIAGLGMTIVAAAYGLSKI